jgi:POT family proton-dependent oligopeptide transporter
MGFEQAGGTFNLFADEKTDRILPAALQTTLSMKEFPASWYQGINPLLIVLLAPLPMVVWSSLERAGFHVNSAAKMGLGLVILGLGFIVMDFADKGSSISSKAGPHWLVIVYLFNTIGELCLSPIGLSVTNNLAHPKIASLMMATWFLCTAIANYLAGIMEELLKHNAPNLPLFSFLIYTSIGAGLLLLVISPLLKKISHGRL